MSNAKRLQDIKAFLERNRLEQAQRKGQLDQIEAQLKGDYGCESVEQARKYREELLTESSRLDLEVAEGLKTIEEELGWN